MCMGDGGRSTAKSEAERQRQEEEERQARVREGADAINSTFAQYDDAFYDGLSQKYLDYANPQLDDQFADAARDLRIALARNGLLQSSVNADRRAKLQEDYDTQARAVAEQARGYANDTRSNLEAVKADLLTQNQSIADPVLIANQANARAAANAELPAFSPLGQLFIGAADGFSTQMDLERRGKNKYNTPELFKFSGSSRLVP